MSISSLVCILILLGMTWSRLNGETTIVPGSIEARVSFGFVKSSGYIERGNDISAGVGAAIGTRGLFSIEADLIQGTVQETPLPNVQSNYQTNFRNVGASTLWEIKSFEGPGRGRIGLFLVGGGGVATDRQIGQDRTVVFGRQTVTPIDRSAAGASVTAGGGLRWIPRRDASGRAPWLLQAEFRTFRAFIGEPRWIQSVRLGFVWRR